MEVKRRIKSRDSVHNLVGKSRKRELKEVKEEDGAQYLNSSDE
jgi:hypothetical protein